MGLMSGLAFSATLDHAEEIANIKKRLDNIEKRIKRLETITMPCVHCKNLTAEVKYFGERDSE